MELTDEAIQLIEEHWKHGVHKSRVSTSASLIGSMG
jgi:hypothetical protein